MNALTTARQAFAAVLEDVITGVNVFAEMPEKVTPPFIVVGPGDPYVEFVEGVPFGHCRVRLFATYVSERGTNDVRAGALDEAIVTLIRKIEADGSFMVTAVPEPGLVPVNNQSHLGASILVLTDTSF